MKFRNQFLKYKLQSEGEDGNPGGGGPQQSATPSGENNNQGDLPTFDDLWDNPSTGGEQNPATPQQPTGQQLSAEEQFQQHVASIDFGADPQAMFQAAQQGNAEVFTEQMQKLTAGIYKAAMLNSNKMLNQRMESMREEMKQTTSTALSSDKLIGRMNEQLPFTKDPAYAPMAKAVLTRLLNKEGMTPEKAIAGTGRYFQDLAKNVSPNGSSGNRDTGTGESGSEDMDWVSFMGGKPS